MKELVLTVSGAGLFIGGAIILNLVFAPLDWKRIGSYGIYNELVIHGGWFSVLIFVLGAIFVIWGAVCLIKCILKYF